MAAMAPHALVGGVGIVGSGLSVVVAVAQEMNSNIKLELSKQRHEKQNNYLKHRTGLQYELESLREKLQENGEQLEELKNRIQEEEKKMSNFENVRNDQNTKFIIALGNTGHGKSTVLNRLCGDTSEDGDEGPFKASDDDQAVTQLVEHKECTICNTQSIVVDTPGYNDGQNRDNLHFNNLESYLYGCGGVDAFLLVCNGTNVRFDENFQNMLKQFELYFGAEFWRHLIIIVTRIEGREKKRFVKRNGTQKLQSNLKGFFTEIGNNDINIPVVTVGFDDDCEEFCGKVMNQVITIANNNDKVVCQHIDSPIKSLKQNKENLEIENMRTNAAIRPKQQAMNNLNVQINALQHKLDIPEQFPLITNRNTQI